MSGKKTNDIIPGVGCDVSSCKYNTTDCKCCANHISVQNEKANSKGETYTWQDAFRARLNPWRKMA